MPGESLKNQAGCQFILFDFLIHLTALARASESVFLITHSGI